MIENQLTDMPFSITEAEVLSVMGYTDISKARKPVRRIVERELEAAEKLCDPWGGVVEVDIDRLEGDHIFLDDGTVLEGERIRKILRQTQRVALMLVTAGEKFTLASRTHVANNKMSVALVVDAIGCTYRINY